MSYVELMFWRTGHTAEAWFVSKPGSLKRFHIAKSNVEDFPKNQTPQGKFTVAIKKWVAEEYGLL